MSGDVAKLLLDKGLTSIPKGKDVLIHCLNPEHEDRNPSLRIDKISGAMHCFSCGFGGNIFTHYNIQRNILDSRVQMLLSKIRNTLSDDNQSMPLGYVPFYKDYRNISKDTFKHFGAFMHSSKEDCIIFPIKDIHGDIKLFQARELYSDQGNRYTFDPPHVKVFMYPTDPTPIQNSIILVEGMFDMLNVWDKGLKNVVCCYGTSMGNVKGERKKKEIRDKFTSFKMQGITSIYIMFDPDPPGRGAAQGLKDNLKDMFFVETIDLSEEQGDPGDLSYSDVQELKKVLYG